jgi:NAD(P)-dependent dehydrogenase (short-subunit alcohol dehydrogenase family)
MLLDGKVVLVSGVGPGLGRDVALRCAAEGAAVVLGARTLERVEKLAVEVQAAGGRATPVALDVTDPASATAAVDAAVAAYGRLDVVVNNAFNYGDQKLVVEADLDHWRELMEVNFFGALQVTRAAVPALRESGDGRVVMVNTMSVRKIAARAGAYAGSKGALETVTKTLAVELGPEGIRVNGIHPGYIWGQSVEDYLKYLASQRGVTPDDVYREIADETCLKYLPSSEEIAGSVLFFASDLSKPVTGQSLSVNAGHWLY